MISFESHRLIQEICRKYNIKKYTINQDGTIDVNQDVNLGHSYLTELPLHFNIVRGSFFINNNKLTSLKGSPIKCNSFHCQNNNLTSLEGGPDFVDSILCHDNQLTTLKGGPTRVSYMYDCHNNNLVSLEGAPTKVFVFDCRKNKLTSLKGGPAIVENDYVCMYNELTSLDGCPTSNMNTFDCSNNKLVDLKGGLGMIQYLYCIGNNILTIEGGPKEVTGFVYMNDNPIFSIYNLFKLGGSNDSKSYERLKKSIDEYDFIRGDKIIESRFRDALVEYGLGVPNWLSGYTII